PLRPPGPRSHRAGHPDVQHRRRRRLRRLRRRREEAGRRQVARGETPMPSTRGVYDGGRPPMPPATGVPLRSPASLGALASRYGGEVDAGAEGLLVPALAPVTVASAGQLAPLFSRRKAYVEAARAPNNSAAILVDAGLAALLPPGRRWVHPDAAFAL